MHVEKAHDPWASLAYCQKDGDTFEFGDRPKWQHSENKKKVKDSFVTVKDLQSYTKEDFGLMKPGTYNSAVRALTDFNLRFEKPI